MAMSLNLYLLTIEKLRVGNAHGVGETAPEQELATVLANLAYFGYAPASAVYAKLRELSSAELAAWYAELEPALREISADNRNMDTFVVYKNFPQEVLDMSEARYWLAQVLLYIGVLSPADVAQPVEARRPHTDELKLKVLSLAEDDAEAAGFANLVAQRSRWTTAQAESARFLFSHLGYSVSACPLDAFGFKLNGVGFLAQSFKDIPESGYFSDATDVLRLGACLSGEDASLRSAVRFRSFTRPERRRLLAMLDNSKNLLADMMLRPDVWKRFMRALRPGDYRYEKVSAAYDRLYRKDYQSFSQSLELALQNKDPGALELLKTRPGIFARLLRTAYSTFGTDAVQAFCTIADKLETLQLLKLVKYAETLGKRKYFIYAPQGQWERAQVAENTEASGSEDSEECLGALGQALVEALGVAEAGLPDAVESEPVANPLKAPFSEEALALLKSGIAKVLRPRFEVALPDGACFSPETACVKLPGNNQELASYGPGTVFPIPPKATFLRTASFWQAETDGYNNIWFDNGWSFFDADWTNLGACCWNEYAFEKSAAVFSGDPVNSEELQGRACQMIDLDLGALAAANVRYAVWSILAYSRVKYSDAADVVASLQWGENPFAGNLYEPARAQMVFPLKGGHYTKYIAYIDVLERKLVYLDANLGGTTESAASNGERLKQIMPAMVEYLAAQPSVADLQPYVNEGSVPFVYSDEAISVTDKAPAYVFRPCNTANDFEPFVLTRIINGAAV